MNHLNRWSRAVAATLLLGASVAAYGHGSVHWSVGIGVPGPWYYPAPAYAPYPYYPPAVVVPPAPSAYVEQAPTGSYSTRPVQSFYYYCAASKSYYPYVRDCPGGWEQVPTQPR